MESMHGGFQGHSLSDALKRLVTEDIHPHTTGVPDIADLKRQCDEILSGKSVSLKLGNDPFDTSTKKVRFLSKEFQDEVQNIRQNFQFSSTQEEAPLEGYKELLHLFTDQIKKEQIIFKVTEQTGESKYSASKKVMEEMETRGLTAISKSGKEKIYVIKRGDTSSVTLGISGNQRVKAIEVSVIESAEFARAADVFQKIIDQMQPRAPIQEIHEEKHKESAVTSGPVTQRAPRQPSAPKEKFERHHEEAADKKTVGTEPRHQKNRVSDEREFRQQEKEKDLKAKEKLFMIEETEEAKKAVKHEEIKKKRH